MILTKTAVITTTTNVMYSRLRETSKNISTSNAAAQIFWSYLLDSLAYIMGDQRLILCGFLLSYPKYYKDCKWPGRYFFSSLHMRSHTCFAWTFFAKLFHDFASNGEIKISALKLTLDASSLHQYMLDNFARVTSFFHE